MLAVAASQPHRPAPQIPQDPASSRDIFSDSRSHGRQGPSRTVRLPRVTSNGGGAISKSEDGLKCVVAGRESLRVLRILDPSQSRDIQVDHKSVSGNGGARIEGSRNFWEGSGLKIDSATTDVVWGHGPFTNKILTSARNGEIIMWDLNKSGVSKYERRTRDHTRSINKLSYSQIVQHYCLTGSADGDVRIWDLRDMTKSVLRIHHPTGVRTLAFSPNQSHPLHTVVGLDNGSIYRWDLTMGQRGQLDRLPVAHAGPILTLNWFIGSSDREKLPSVSTEGWVATGGLDRCVKIWDFNATAGSNYLPTYCLHTAFPVRRVLWRPSYECELAVVSNADFGTGPNSDLASGSKMPSPRMTERPISGDLTGSLDELRIHLHQKLRDETSFSAQTTQNNGFGDSVEIWDVRRQHIAKWVVNGSAVEGGVTDIAFGDSHSLWTQHSSGAFSQLDLRHAWKPLEAVSSTALSWEVSGALAFVSDSPSSHSIPYDDVDPGKKQFVQDRKMRMKGLGDPVYLPQSQNLGSHTHDWAAEDVEGFIKLAHGYLLEGADRPSICRFNASMARNAGREDAAQTWTLLEYLLTDLVPTPTPSLSPLRIMNPGLPHSLSAPAVLPSMHSSPSPRMDSNKTSLSDAGIVHLRSPHISPARHGSASTNADLGTSSYGRPTPTSSPASSPQRASLNLPSLPIPNTPFPSSLFARRQSSAGLVSNASSSFRPRLSSSLRRPSMSTPSTSSDAPSGPTSVRGYAASLKHVGEGALDDSDSSGEEEDNEDEKGSSNEDAEEEPSLQPLISPYLFPRNTISHPSPLSRMVKQQDWLSEDDEEGDREASPSPASTDSEGNSSGSPRKRSDGHRKRTGPRPSKNRSRSSTVASLAAPPTAIGESRKSLVKQESHSSIRTVTAGDTSIREGEAFGLHQEETVRDLNNGDKAENTSLLGHKRQISEAVVSELVLDDCQEGDEDDYGIALSEKIGSSRRKEAIEGTENRYRELGWEALREAFETFSEQGDVQMCAVLAMIAPKELCISQLRSLRFFESYIEILSRLRLYTSAAYLRKYVGSEDIRIKATLQTTIHTSCGRCRKAILIPSGPRRYDEPSGGYSYCLQCQSRISKCSICHLPAKALLFQCAVCMHGGHQKCYRKYYTERPMVELPSPASVTQENKGHDDNHSAENQEEGTPAAGSYDPGATTEFLSPNQQRNKVFGHPCAAGCGHYCWAVMERQPFP